MTIKAIIFDIDGVIIKSDVKKEKIIKNILEKHNLYDIQGVKEILGIGLNRKLVFEKINELTPINKEKLLQEFNKQNAILENNAIKNDNIVNFIKSNYTNYIFSTNTSLPSESLDRVIKKALNIEKYFKELLAFENGSKVENVNYILNKYNLNPENILFIDDNINHIEKVRKTGVHTLYFDDYSINIDKEIIKLK